MKEYIQTIIVFTLMLCLIPCLVFLSSKNKQTVSANAKADDIDKVKIYFTKEKKSEEFSLKDYMVGAVLAQMPADFEPEALKAQAVLAHTYILYRKQAEETSPTKNLKGCLISDDDGLYQGFFTKQQAEEFYGEDYKTALKKVTSAVNDVLPFTLTYKDEPVIVAFHGVSCGYTMSAEDAWGIDCPYLKSVESKWDNDVEGMKQQKEMTAQEVGEALKKISPNGDFSDLSKADTWIDVRKITEYGCVTEVCINGEEVAVDDFLNALELPSACFTFKFENTKFTFSVKGYGHLVGMSQYGANEMAKAGSDFKKILEHYYTDCKIKRK